LFFPRMSKAEESDVSFQLKPRAVASHNARTHFQFEIGTRLWRFFGSLDGCSSLNNR
jgi:hypothetical protein